VASASVEIGDRPVSRIDRGLLVLLGVENQDGPGDVKFIAQKVRDLRVFESEDGHQKMDRSVVEIGGAVLVVSQFTLCGDCRKGRRPSFDAAAPPAIAQLLYEEVVRELRGLGVHVETGEFQAMMRVHLINDGPVTLLLDSRRRF
jgi:D-tyrosyl-tRNA(Tyr) deacylase